MSDQKHWLLPAGIEEELPDSALRIENLREKILDLFDAWGYDLVIPPMLEYLESLLITNDESLNLRTLKLTDQLNGKTMGLRADMTAQVARIDAHSLSKSHSNRLCYIGTVIHARPIDISGIRSMIQFGAEVYGHTGIESDVEIISLMLEAMRTLGVGDAQLDLGHVGIYSALVQAAGLSVQDEGDLFDLVQMKAAHEVQTYLSDRNIASTYIDYFVQLVGLHGGVEILEQARRIFDGVDIEQVLRELDAVSKRLNALGAVERPHYDLADLGGYHYNSGVVFAAFSKNLGKEIARGGRYDNVGKAFGKDRPATGFSSDLKRLAELAAILPAQRDGIFAPQSDDSMLYKKVAELRRQGYRVVQQLNADETAQDLACSRALVLRKNQWQAEKL